MAIQRLTEVKKNKEKLQDSRFELFCSICGTKLDRHDQCPKCNNEHVTK